ncbi:hypothetical protein EPJ67_08000 [Brachyspira aalborgi]|uniref:Uncharacterized protein n=1 Tax=Brachyspira aalborgi TaxID=29522 RepID=A0A5C8G2C9_9SPIR|nr:hypothetical protein [Brachyspira aalborgi]TXJ56192.1 hypothetical protein EPJ67_08000 [Brachyspira aalborgi]
MGIINWAARKVQNFTGETDRKQIVAQTKLEYVKSRKEIEYIVQELNYTIEKFNIKIVELNNYREKRIKNDVEKLGSFLSTFGNIKDISEYSEEKEKSFFNIPERAFEEVENYIADIDWSSDEVFLRTFFQGGAFASIFTRGQNIKMLERLEEFKNSVINMKDKLNNKIKMIEKVDMRVCDLYIELIKAICYYIEFQIVPQIEVIQSFLECESVKNVYIADTKAKTIENVEYETDIKLYDNTIYQKHYNFVRNSFWFYILSATIYSSPVLTKLLENKKITDNDIEKLEGQKLLCKEQIMLLESNKI